MDHQQLETQKYKNLGKRVGITKEFHFEELQRATNNFMDKNLLGSGGSGSVFKGVLNDKTEVAVKRVDNIEYGERQFVDEVLAIASLKHANIVYLCGYSTHLSTVTGRNFFHWFAREKKERTFYIVYDLIQNGSLDTWIFKREGKHHCLPWKARYKVSLDIAKALVYLHHDCSESFLHLDIKPANILLDKDFRAVLSDFGMSKLMKKDQRTVFTTRRGTFGYIAPEWYDGVSIKCDIFSYGKVLMDLFFGQCYVCLDKGGKDIYRSHLEGGNSRSEQKIFVKYMQQELEGGKIMNHIDKRVLEKKNEKVNEEEVACLVRTALLCIQYDPHKRPRDMKEVSVILEGKNIGDDCSTNVLLPIFSTSLPARPYAEVPQHFDAFASREATKSEVIQTLMNNSINMVGVYGMGGVGKTTLVKQVREEVIKTKLFDTVVLATISQNLNLRYIQAQIAEGLGIKLEVETLLARADKLAELLRRARKILLILDDVWERFDLVDLGVVVTGACNVLITSRSSDICRSMGTTHDIEVELLSKEDSLELFRQEVGSEDFDVQREMSKKIVNECAGLPLAIVTIARTLRKKDEGIWVAVAEQLKKSIYEDMDVVTTSIRLSYNFFSKSRKSQKCFLLCALFPEDHEITMDTLVGYAMGEDLLGDGETLKEARENLHIMVDKLISSGLLLKNVDKQKNILVKMHDIVRDTALTIAREENNMSIIKSGSGLKRWPKVYVESCLRMSLMKNDICVVPSAPRCLQLVTLSLANNPNLKIIPNCFFEGMQCLATLDLSKTGISSLPQSLSFLENCLRSIYLYNCAKLESLSGIGNLISLEVLGLRNTGIRLLPDEIKKLTNLKMLDLGGSFNFTYIPSDLISSLSSLEELNLHKSFSKWAIVRYGQVSLGSLTNLTSLDFDLHDTKFLSIDMGRSPWEKLSKFSILWYNPFETWPELNGERCLSLETSASSFPLADWVMILLERTYELKLVLNDCENITNIFHLNSNGFPNLKFLEISNADTMEYFVNVTEQIPHRVFPQLEHLKLSRLFKLKAIWNGPFLEGSFKKLESLKICECDSLVHILPYRLQVVFHVGGNSNSDPSSSRNDGTRTCVSNNLIAMPQSSIFSNLKYILIEGCYKLESIFSVGILLGLMQLEDLTIIDCNKLEGITKDCQLKEGGGGSNNIVRLPRLRTMRLTKLPKLSGIFSHQGSWFPHILLQCPSLVELEIDKCENMKRLPFGPQSTPKLQKFTCEEEWFKNLEWHDLSVKSQLQPHTQWILHLLDMYQFPETAPVATGSGRTAWSSSLSMEQLRISGQDFHARMAFRLWLSLSSVEFSNDSGEGI